ncbi:hypothetical protein [Pseudofrankia asymbiotica]|uniref:EamA domain-containing protein n=1 Tax=Pseudofrankia asymbiotica TaxID=1834516 RepID=A0A1V2I6Q7_9ACTN|nr:hypothetical protein [Pseudofrankia asymbiotica]ONH26979.1 hypothetical protein BL253_23300 [Pseudofrankia asymbiotica]
MDSNPELAHRADATHTVLMLAPLPATAIALAVLGQVPTYRDLAGVALVIAGVVLHQPAANPPVPASRPAANETKIRHVRVE